MTEFGDENTMAAKRTGVSRRTFLKYAIGGAAGAAVLGFHGHTVITNLVGGDTPIDRLEQMDKNSFVERLGEIFTVSEDVFDTTVSLRLVEVKDVIFDNPGMVGEVFSLLFEGPYTSPLEQGTYMVHNKTAMSFPLFLVPMYSDTSSMYYEAIFNRLET
jgi:hypothetical protein